MLTKDEGNECLDFWLLIETLCLNTQSGISKYVDSHVSELVKYLKGTYIKPKISVSKQDKFMLKDHFMSFLVHLLTHNQKACDRQFICDSDHETDKIIT